MKFSSIATIFAFSSSASVTANQGGIRSEGNVADKLLDVKKDTMNPKLKDEDDEDFFGRGNLELGDKCRKDSSCKSGACSVSLFRSGSCVECTADDHCKGGGESLAGAMPKASCVETQCSVWKRGKPINQEGYPIKKGPNDDDLLRVKLKRNIYAPEEESFEAASIVWHFDMNNQMGDTANKFEANATHVRVPAAVEMLGGYSMNNHVIQEHETGILSAMFLANPYSVIIDRPEVGEQKRITH